MSEKILVVRANELNEKLAFRRFKALPEEEILRHHAAIEVLAMDHDLAERDPAFKQLVTCTAIHYNYSWLTYQCGRSPGEAPPSGSRSLAIGGHIHADDHDQLFLDDDLKIAVSHEVDRAVIIHEKNVLRLAGLLEDDSDAVSRMHLGLVYIASLKQPGGEQRQAGIAGIRFCGMGELQQQRDQFESQSQILIDNLLAF